MTLRRAVKPALRVCAVAAFACLAASVQAERPTERYAAAQLAYAEVELERAEQALAGGNYALARRLARQAGLDARLAWSMTDSAAVRRAAAGLSGDSAQLSLKAQQLLADGLHRP